MIPPRSNRPWEPMNRNPPTHHHHRRHSHHTLQPLLRGHLPLPLPYPPFAAQPVAKDLVLPIGKKAMRPHQVPKACNTPRPKRPVSPLTLERPQQQARHLQEVGETGEGPALVEKREVVEEEVVVVEGGEVLVLEGVVPLGQWRKEQWKANRRVQLLSRVCYNGPVG